MPISEEEMSRVDNEKARIKEFLREKRSGGAWYNPEEIVDNGELKLELVSPNEVENFLFSLSNPTEGLIRSSYKGKPHYRYIPIASH